MKQNPRRTILITGASSGIGAQFARSYARRGFDLVLVARRLDRLEALARDLREKNGISAHCLPADLSARDDVKDLLERLTALNIAPDGLINNAGYSIARSFAATALRQQMDFVEVCVAAPTLLAHELIGAMLERGWGRIINVSSIVAFSPGAAGHTLYPAAKAYLLKFSRSLAAEVAEKGVKVTALCPGTTESEFQTANGMVDVLKERPERLSMRTDRVVEAAIVANEAGREVIVTGLVNKAAVALMGLAPDPLVTALVRWGARRYQMPD